MPHYALIDCAADPALYGMLLREEGCNYKCLFAGAVDPDLISASPHIVQLEGGSVLHRELLSRGWTQNWGIVCASEASLWDVRRQLRSNLQAMLPDGKVVLFRFYDPRVFASYIEKCEPQNLESWFGQISDYWVPTEAGTLRYSMGQAGLQKQVLHPTGNGATS